MRLSDAMGAPRAPVDPLGRLLERSASVPSVELVAVLTLFLVIFHGFDGWPFGLAVTVTAALALLHRPVLLAPLPWLVITVVAASELLGHWYPVDNHKFVLCYWTAALFLAFLLPRSEAAVVLGVNGRFLLVAVMGLAVVQKLLSPSYVSSAFFEIAFLTDGRFRDFLEVLGLDLAPLYEAARRFDDMKDAYLVADVRQVEVTVSPRLSLLADLVTWWVVAIEGAIAVAFAVCRPGADRIGHGLLLVFLVTTYVVAPVIGFAVTLIILALACCPPTWQRLRLCYLAALLLMEAYGAVT